METNEAIPTSARKKVFVVANLYHASPRIPALCKFLPKHGWDPTVLTPRLKNIEGVFNAPSKEVLSQIKIVEVGEPVIYEERKKESRTATMAQTANRIANKIDPSVGSPLSRRIERLYWSTYSLANFPDPDKGWKEPALEKARELMGRVRYDLILSSSSPVITHIVAEELSREYGIPWVAELRDLWSQNHNLPSGRTVRRMTTRLERIVLGKAEALVTVNPSMAEELATLHKDKRIFSFTNGYDPSIPVKGLEKSSKFIMTYTGQIYRGKQDPSLVLEAVSRLIDRGKVDRTELEIRFFGPWNEDVDKLTKEMRLEGVVRQMGVVPREESYRRQRESSVLLSFSWEDAERFGVVTLKFYEYLGSGRPILVTKGKPEDVVVKIIESTRCGKVAFNLEETEDAILSYFNEFKKTGRVACNCVASEVARYSYENIAKDYAALLDLVIGKVP